MRHQVGATRPRGGTIATEDFARWYHSLVDDESRTNRSDRDRTALERWFRELYDTEGPVSKELAVERFLSPFVAVAKASVEAVLGDIERTTALRPTVVVDTPGDTLRIEYRSEDGSSGYQSPSMLAFDATEALAEVADYLQDFVMDDLHGAWPECFEHAVGAHAEIHDDAPVWWCRAGSHSIGGIGSLHS
jgi:hypothetical protein